MEEAGQRVQGEGGASDPDVEGQARTMDVMEEAGYSCAHSSGGGGSV